MVLHELYLFLANIQNDDREEYYILVIMIITD